MTRGAILADEFVSTRTCMLIYVHTTNYFSEIKSYFMEKIYFLFIYTIYGLITVSTTWSPLGCFIYMLANQNGQVSIVT